MDKNTYTVMYDGSLKVALTKGYRMIIDLEDADLLYLYTWHVGTSTKKPIAMTRIEGKCVLFHRMVMERIGNQNNDPVVHLNGNTLDNRRRNIVARSHSHLRQNCRMRKDNRSGFTGVTFDTKTSKWVGKII